jgi:hypothetical protein
MPGVSDGAPPTSPAPITPATTIPRPPGDGAGGSSATIALTRFGRSSAATQANVAPSPCVMKIAGPVSSSSFAPLKRHAVSAPMAFGNAGPWEPMN